MSRPDDIPQDVWDAVSGLPIISENFDDADFACVARAIMAEREACAQIAHGFPQNRDWVPGSLYGAIRREVAAAIRNRKETP